MRFKLAGAIVTGLLLTALSAAPADAATNTITVGSVTLTNRVLVMVPVTVVCDPLPGTSFDSAVSVTVTQASGQAVATGQTFDETLGAPLFTCDSVTQNHLVVDVLPNPGSPPFHGGKAIVQASFGIFSGGSNSEGGSTTVTVSIRG